MNPIQKAIEEIRETLVKAKCGYLCANPDVSDGVVIGLEMALKRIAVNLDDAAMVDVKSTREKCSGLMVVREFSTTRFFCHIKDADCPGLGNDGCPAYIVKGEGE